MSRAFRHGPGEFLTIGRFSLGCALWPGKPWFLASCEFYYDVPIYVFHLGPFWAEWS